MYRVVEGPVFCALALELNEENVRSLKKYYVHYTLIVHALIKANNSRYRVLIGI